MKLALGISLMSASALVLLYSILMGVMVPGWKNSVASLFNQMDQKVFTSIYDTKSGVLVASNLPNSSNGWITTNMSNIHPNLNWTIVVAIRTSDTYGDMEHSIVVASCAGLGVLVFLVLVLWLSIHFCVSRPIYAKKRGDTDIPYTIFEEAK